MDLRSNTKKSQFDAFKGFSLSKDASKSRSSKVDLGRFAIKNSQKQMTTEYNFDNAWRGSISNLMSCENITEELINESVRELENAMNESKRMLLERDQEIMRLRNIIEQNGKEKQNNEKPGPEKHLLEQLADSQKQIMSLEKEMCALKLEYAKAKTNLENEDDSKVHVTGSAECTCYCGSVCKALVDLNELKKNYRNTKTKYDNLRGKVKEFRRQAQLEHREFEMRNEFLESEKSNCVIQ